MVARGSLRNKGRGEWRQSEPRQLATHGKNRGKGRGNPAATPGRTAAEFRIFLDSDGPPPPHHPPLQEISSASSGSFDFIPPPAGCTGIRSVLRHFRVDVSNLSLQALCNLRNRLVPTPAWMQPQMPTMVNIPIDPPEASNTLLEDTPARAPVTRQRSKWK